ncbi:MAG: type II secretion system protein [Phycisphaerae bacterium]
MPQTKRHFRRAFTLVEALAVITIVGIVLPAVMYGISISTGAAGLARQRDAASALAANKLTEIVGTNAWQTGDANGDVEDAPLKFHWVSHVQDWTESNLHQVTVEVSWTGRGRERTVAVSTLVYDGGGGTLTP